MSSAIDPSRPRDGMPAMKAELRTNLMAAKTEIEALQVGLARGLAGKADRVHAHRLSDITDAGALARLDRVSGAEIAPDSIGPAHLTDMAITPGRYCNPEITVDRQGRLTAVTESRLRLAKFHATNNSRQSWRSTRFIDLTSWTGLIADAPDFAFDGTTLICRFAGWIDVSANVSCRRTCGFGAARPRMRLERNGIAIDGSRAEGHTRRWWSGDHANLASRVLVEVAKGDRLKVQVAAASPWSRHRLLEGCCAFTAIRIA